MSNDTDDDPFDRAVRRERDLRRDGNVLTMRMVKRWFAYLGLAWAALLAAHWLLFPEPRWLAVLHTIVFALQGGGALAAALAQTRLAALQRRAEV